MLAPLQDVIVARGRFAREPPAHADTREIHMLTSDPAGQRYVGGGSGSVGEMLRWVEEKCLHQPVVNLAEYPTELSVGWYYYASGKVYQRPTEAGRREATEAFLDIRARQTGLTFTVEPRDVEVWRLEPRADPPQAAGCQ